MTTDSNIFPNLGPSGLTKRELFALVSLHALQSNPNFSNNKVALHAKAAVTTADMLIRELNTEPEYSNK